jgi:hypothetical protein
MRSVFGRMHGPTQTYSGGCYEHTREMSQHAGLENDERRSTKSRRITSGVKKQAQAAARLADGRPSTAAVAAAAITADAGGGGGGGWAVETALDDAAATVNADGCNPTDSNAAAALPVAATGGVSACLPLAPPRWVWDPKSTKATLLPDKGIFNIAVTKRPLSIAPLP